jgi:hypothetical protein
VQGEDHALALIVSQAAEQGQGVQGVAGVEAGQRLVGQQPVGLAGQAAGDQGASPLAAGQARDRSVGEGLQAGGGDGGVDRGAVLAAGSEGPDMRRAPQPTKARTSTSQAISGVWARKAIRRRVGGRAWPDDGGRPGSPRPVRFQQTRQARQQGRLARAVGADDGDQPPLAKRR